MRYTGTLNLLLLLLWMVTTSCGQTGSGKTHTMCGSSGGSDQPRSWESVLNDLFELSNQRKDIIKFEIQVQMTFLWRFLHYQIRDPDLCQ